MSAEIKKHALAAEVEAASGGKQTVLVTAKGQATYMNVIPAFNLEDLGAGYGTGLHPAFLVGGVPKKEIYIGTYQAVMIDGEAVSLPGQDPATNIDFDEARAACAACGSGFHLMTNWEWAALALRCEKDGLGQLRGNTASGRSHAKSEETGTPSKYGRTLTGSGPDSWRHDGTPYGIADMVGNVWEWSDGLKLRDGRIIMPADNNFLLPESEWVDTGARIDFAEGGMQVAGEIAAERDWDSEMFRDVKLKDGYEPSIALKQALVCPLPGQDIAGRFWADNTEDFEALPIRGGDWFLDDIAGLAALDLDSGRGDRSSLVGFRPAFVVG